MISSIEIQNFKNLEHLSISNLGRVNLFTGKNNTGKTSLLEAISIIANGGNLYTILEIIKKRNPITYIKTTSFENGDSNFDFDKKYVLDIVTDLFNYKITNENSIELDSVVDNIEFKQSLSIVNVISSTEHQSEGKYKTTAKKTFVEVSEDVISKNETRDYIYEKAFKIVKNNQKHLYTFQIFIDLLLDPFILTIESNQVIFINNFGRKKQDNGYFWDQIILTTKYQDVITALQIIDPNIEELVFTGSGSQRNAKVKLKNLDKQISLSTMGDGINKILNIILSLVNCKDGYLLIDEFENGLHYTVQEKLWEIIFRISKDLNVQVFATTHSRDSIEAFSKVLNNQENKESGKFLRLEKQKDIMVGIEYTNEELQNVFEYDFELR